MCTEKEMYLKKKSLLWSTLKYSLFIGSETMPNPFLPQCSVFNFSKTFADLAQRILNSDEQNGKDIEISTKQNMRVLCGPT